MGRLAKNKALGFFVVIFAVSFITGCSDTSGEERLPLESNVIFSIKESYPYGYFGEPMIQLSMRTEERYPILQYQLLSDVKVKEDRISVDIECVYFPGGFSNPAFGPATYDSFLVIPNGEYGLYFSYKRIKDEYILTVTDSSIEISPEISILTDPSFEVFWRYPENSFVCYGVPHGSDTEADSLLFEGFVDSLAIKIDLEEFEFPTYGEIPYPHQGTWEYDTRFFRYFYYQGELDFDRAGELLESYIENVLPDSSYLGIELLNWKNKRYSSWDFRE